MTPQICLIAFIALNAVSLVALWPKWNNVDQCLYFTRKGKQLKRWPIEPADILQYLIYYITVISYVIFELYWLSSGNDASWDISFVKWHLVLYALQFVTLMLWAFERTRITLEFLLSFIVLFTGTIVEVVFFLPIFISDSAIMLDFSSFMFVTPLLNSFLGLLSEIVLQPIWRSMKKPVDKPQKSEDKKIETPASTVSQAPVTVVGQNAVPQPPQRVAVPISPSSPRPSSTQPKPISKEETNLRKLIGLPVTGSIINRDLEHAVNLITSATYQKHYGVLMQMLLGIPSVEEKRQLVIAVNKLWHAVVKREKVPFTDQMWEAVHNLALLDPEAAISEWAEEIFSHSKVVDRVFTLFSIYQSVLTEEETEEEEYQLSDVEFDRANTLLDLLNIPVAEIGTLDDELKGHLAGALKMEDGAFNHIVNTLSRIKNSKDARKAFVVAMSEKSLLKNLRFARG